MKIMFGIVVAIAFASTSFGRSIIDEIREEVEDCTDEFLDQLNRVAR